MDADTIKAELANLCPAAKLRLGDTQGFYWLSLTTQAANGQTHTKSTRLDLDATPLDLQIALKHIQYDDA